MREKLISLYGEDSVDINPLRPGFSLGEDFYQLAGLVKKETSGEKSGQTLKATYQELDDNGPNQGSGHYFRMYAHYKEEVDDRPVGPASAPEPKVTALGKLKLKQSLG